jgi:DSF synthase
MGAYSFLTKKVGFNKANEIINSNKSYSAKEIFDLGIINEVCDDGFGIAKMSTMIKSGEMEKYKSNPFMSICNRVSKQELIDVVNVWLEKAFTLSEDNLNRMMKLSNAQKRKVDQLKKTEPIVEDELKMAEINTLINSSFPTKP